jgi:hypothetical protein
MLARHADRVVALFGKITAIQNQHALGASERPRDGGLMGLKHLRVRPRTRTNELLHRLDVSAFQSLCHRFYRFAFNLQHLSFQILVRPVALLLAFEETGEEVQSGFAPAGGQRCYRNRSDQFLSSVLAYDFNQRLYHLERKVSK